MSKTNPGAVPRDFPSARIKDASGRLALARDLRDAAGARRNPELESVQLDDGADQAEAESQPRVAAAFLRAIETPADEVLLAFQYARTAVAHAHDGIVALAQKVDFDAAAFRREFHRVVDEVGDGFEQQIAVAAH